MKKLTLIILSLFFISCGGGGGSSPTTTNTTTLDIFPITPVGTSTDYSDYAWNITPKSQLNTSLASYNIDENANIHMPTSTNSSKIKVAIIDQGFQYTHPDIYDKIIDVTNVNTTVLADEYHGTTVAGVLASTYLGVAPNNVELILININFDEVSEAELIAAFNYAKDQGAKVISCSWGTTYDETQSYAFSQQYLNTLQSMKDAGISVVFAAGNNGYNLDNNWMDESELTSTIGVGATSKDNTLASYTNYGSNIDIYAPGGTTSLGILTLDLTGSAGTNNFSDNNYSLWYGSSYSTPTIAGVITLMLSVNPNLTPEAIRQILINNADTVSGSYLKVNAANAVQAAINAI